jgi:hypothetical protein
LLNILQTFTFKVNFIMLILKNLGLPSWVVKFTRESEMSIIAKPLTIRELFLIEHWTFFPLQALDFTKFKISYKCLVGLP